mmetsp:Transcript_98661/g.175681  ORF Transcript_98661/g.175681 Transcript_98661/m.175681 type:complete len:137 (-) Transcript_98661:59-469(-)
MTLVDLVKTNSPLTVKCSVQFACVYAALIFVGGLIGFVKAGSKASIIASTVIAVIILGLDYVTMEVSELYGQVALLVLTLVLIKMFKGKWDGTAEKHGLNEPLSEAPKKKFMPFGLLFFMSIFMFIFSLNGVLLAM